MIRKLDVFHKAVLLVCPLINPMRLMRRRQMPRLANTAMKCGAQPANGIIKHTVQDLNLMTLGMTCQRMVVSRHCGAALKPTFGFALVSDIAISLEIAHKQTSRSPSNVRALTCEAPRSGWHCFRRIRKLPLTAVAGHRLFATIRSAVRRAIA